MFFDSIIREDRSILDLLTADYSFVNERLARHYGIPDIYGSQFRRVTITEPARRGLLGQGSILGMPVPPPPPDVPPLKEQTQGEKPKTMREQMVEHRANPVCASCHKIMDP